MQDVLTEFADRVRPGHTAVVVVDIQNDFCAAEGYGGKVLGRDVSNNAPMAEANIALVDAARSCGALVIWVQAIFDAKYLSAPVLAKKAERQRTGELCVDGTWGADFFMVEPGDGEYIVKKHRYGAFIGTSLDNILRENGILTLVVTGVQTNVCVETTLREGLSRGYYIVVPEDCVATHAPDLHDATLKNVENLFGDVTTSEALMGLWGGAAEDSLGD